MNSLFASASGISHNKSAIMDSTAETFVIRYFSDIEVARFMKKVEEIAAARDKREAEAEKARKEKEEARVRTNAIFEAAYIAKWRWFINLDRVAVARKIDEVRLARIEAEEARKKAEGA